MNITALVDHRDHVRSSHWAVASLGGGGAVAGVNFYDFVNLDTGRAYRATLTTGGLSAGFSASASSPSYTEFRTRAAVNFNDFDGAGVRLTSANIGIFYGYGVSYLTIWRGPAYFGPVLATITINDWGVMLPGASAAAHGVLKIVGMGRPLGTVALHFHLEEELPREERLLRVKISPRESAVLLPGDVLFDFDSTKLRLEAVPVLRNAAAIVNRRDVQEVSIEGHADSIGSAEYNNQLSLNRAQSVKSWMVRERVSGAESFRVRGWGESKSIAPNKKPDGSDNPEGRQMNRRVEIVFGKI